MPGREDNNKHESANRSSSTQSNQNGKGGNKTRKSNHGDQTEAKTLKQQDKSKDLKVERNTDVDQE